jgi:DNA (cytosine-5)-methyltransferase 1
MSNRPGSYILGNMSSSRASHMGNAPGTNEMKSCSISHMSNASGTNEMRSSIDSHRKMRIDGGFKLLDLFCGEGLAAWGYWLSGRFTEIVGVDINPSLKKRYAFDFINRDALSLDYDFLQQFDFIHCSPPCQGYSKATPDQSKHERLIPGCHLMCVASGLPYVIENVEGSTKDLKPNLVIDGHSVGLNITRRRYFYVSQLKKPVRLLSSGTIANFSIHDAATRNEMIEAFGLSVINEKRRSFLTRRGIEEGIPPAFTKKISELVLRDKFLIV